MDDFRTTVDAYKVAMHEINNENNAVHVKKLVKKSQLKWIYIKTCCILAVCSLIPLLIFLTVPLFLIVTVAMIVKYNTFAEEGAGPINAKSEPMKKADKDHGRDEPELSKVESFLTAHSANAGREAGRKFAKKLFG